MYRASLVALALLTPLAVVNAQAQTQRAVPRDSQTYRNSQAYNEGYTRGTRAGSDDGQRNREYNYANKSDYRNGDAGYRREYGDRERYRVDFRLGFEFGYREGYGRYRPGYGGYGRNDDYGRYDPYGRNDGWRPGTGGPPPWANGRARGRGRGGYQGGGYQGGGYQYNELAFRNGFTDGYEAGLKDGRDRRRFEATSEGRYRDGDRGYNRDYYGSRDIYRLRYREAFIEGYEYGYEDGRRYDSRNYNNNRPWWWPW